MVTEQDVEDDEIILGNGDTLAERLENVDLDEDETSSTDEMRERLDL
jgi:hypothetical protein